jgi:DNA-binding NarL/FixJ family response regulator
MARRIRILIADDHPIVLEGLQAVFAAESDTCRIVARCTDGAAACEAIRDHCPDVAIVNLRMPPAGGLAVVRQVREEQVPVRIVLFTAAIDEMQALEAVRLGADGILLKELSPQLIRECVRKVARGEHWIERGSATKVIERIASGSPGAFGGSGLTRREYQLMRLAASGLRNREIARRLKIGEGTVKIHLHSVYRKLGVRGRVQLALHARSHGLV